MAADGSIVIDTSIDNKQAQKELNALTKKIDSLNDRVYQKKQEQMPLVAQAKQLGAELDSAKAKLAYMQSGKEFVTSASIRQQTDAVTALQTDWNKTQSQVDRYDAAIQKSNLEMNRCKEKAGELSAVLGTAGYNAEAMDKASKRAGKSMNIFSSRLRGVLLSAFVFNALSAGLRTFTSWLGKAIKTNDEASAAIARLKGAMLTLAQPILEKIIPAFVLFVNVLTNIITNISQLISWLFGTTQEQSRKSTEALYEESNAIGATGAAAKKASKSLAGFDEINKLSGETASGAGGAAAGMGDAIQPDFSAFDTVAIKGKVDEITTYLMGSLLALGAILAFSGANIPLGIGLMAVGAIGLAAEIAANWDSMTLELKRTITNVLVLLGTSFLAIGAILVFSGADIPLGIGMMLLGVASLAAAAKLNWGSIRQPMQEIISGILTLLGISLLAVGAIFAFTGTNIPLGIGLMLLGAASLGAAVALNWDTVKNNIGGIVTELLVILGTALLVIGAVLAFSFGNLPLGIGLMAVGAASLATAAALNWDALTGEMSGTVGKILAVVGASLLVLGAILTFSGANAPLGIAMMIAGGASLATAAALNWDWILDKLKGAWSNIKAWWQSGPSKYFTAEYWLNLGQDIVDGFVDGIKSIGTKAMDWGGNVIEDIRNGLGTHSPSVKTEAAAEDTGDGFILGLQNRATQLDTALLTFTGAVLTAFDQMNLDLATRQETAQTNSTTSLTMWMDNAKLLFSNFFADVLLQADTWALNLQLKLDAMVEAAVRAAAAIAAAMSSSGGGSGSVRSASGGSPRMAALANAYTAATPYLPALATGAVIPPNREFLAVLDNQKSGTNIEAPLATIVQAVMMALAKSGYGGKEQVIENVLQLDGEVIYRNQKKVSRRHGVHLVEV